MLRKLLGVDSGRAVLSVDFLESDCFTLSHICRVGVELRVLCQFPSYDLF